jgi:dihydroorotase
LIRWAISIAFMSTFLIKHAKIVDPGGPHHEQVCDLLIANGQIKEIASKIDSPNLSAQVIEAEGLHLSAGWMDTGVQLADPGFEYRESLQALGQAAALGGYTRILCYPNTQPVVDQAQMIHALQARGQQLPVHLHLMGCISQHGEGQELAELYDMHRAGALAFSDGEPPVQSSSLLLKALQYAQSFGGLLVHRPDDHHLSQGGQMNEGINSTRLGLKAIPEVAESSAVARLLDLLSYTGGRLHLQPLSSPVALQHLQQFDAAQAQLSVGVNIAHLLYDDEVLLEFDNNYKLIPPLRSRAQRLALQQALRQGHIDLLCSGHRALSKEEKEVEFTEALPGIIALQTAFSQAYEGLIQSELLSLSDWVEKVSIRPRAIFGLPELRVVAGAPAELSLFLPEQSWTLGPAHLFSRAFNSPLLGQQLQGKVLGTLVKSTFYPAHAPA